ncbi:MAG: hypothetical protein ACM3VV_02160 [Deltaproteobacteria bacterium]|jgi:hypothetical protein
MYHFKSGGKVGISFLQKAPANPQFTPGKSGGKGYNIGLLN